MTTILSENHLRKEDTQDILGNFTTIHEKSIIGTIKLEEEEEIKKIQQNWNTGNRRITCGTDGGLKDGIGTTGYVIYNTKTRQQILTGYSGEEQVSTSASSTRHELRAQLR